MNYDKNYPSSIRKPPGTKDRDQVVSPVRGQTTTIKKLKLRDDTTFKQSLKKKAPKGKVQYIPNKAANNAIPDDLTNQYDPVALNDYMSLKHPHFTHITQTTLVPNVDDKLYSCRLKLHCEVEYGQYVCVIGSIPELGNWQQYICPMMWTEGHIWVLQQPIVTTKPHFLYKYALMEDDNLVKIESGVSRIADLELLPNLQEKSNEFLDEQKRKILSTSKDAKNKLKALKTIKNVVLTDVWETFQIRWTVNQPFEDNGLDMILEGNIEEIDH